MYVIEATGLARWLTNIYEIPTHSWVNAVMDVMNSVVRKKKNKDWTYMCTDVHDNKSTKNETSVG